MLGMGYVIFLTLLHCMIRDSIGMCTNVQYIGTSKPLLFRGRDEMNFFKREVHQPKQNDFTDVVYAFDVPLNHVSDSL